MRDLQKILDNIDGPVIELAGPTPEGYELLRKYKLDLPESTVITNKTLSVADSPFGDNDIFYSVDDVVDIMSLPYKDKSVAFYLASYIPLTTFDGSEIEDDEERFSKQKEQQQKATKEIEQILAGNFQGKPKYSLHACLFQEVSRTLKRPGYLLYQGVRDYDRELAHFYGFEEVLLNRSDKAEEMIQSILLKIE